MEEENKVSVWIGKLDNKEKFQKYISVVYDEDGDMGSTFMNDFKIEYYDTQFQEALFSKAIGKNEIFKDFSYIENFLKKIPSQYLSGSDCFIMLYNFKYNGGIEKHGNFRHIGVFDYR